MHSLVLFLISSGPAVFGSFVGVYLGLVTIVLTIYIHMYIAVRPKTNSSKTASSNAIITGTLLQELNILSDKVKDVRIVRWIEGWVSGKDRTLDSVLEIRKLILPMIAGSTGTEIEAVLTSLDKLICCAGLISSTEQELGNVKAKS